MLNVFDGPGPSRGRTRAYGLTPRSRAHQTYRGELLAIIAPGNLASQNVAGKLGFTF